MAGEPPPTPDVFLLYLSESGTANGENGRLLKALRDRDGEFRTVTIEDVEISALDTAIETSRIAIVVLSGDYHRVAFCRWNALGRILRCFKRDPQSIIPVYYTDRSAALEDLFSFYDTHKKRRRNREKAQKDREKAQKDREKVLKDVYKLSKVIAQVDKLPGWDYNGGAIARYRDEFESKIARLVSKRLSRVPLYTPVDSVGLESRLEELWGLLSLTSSNRNFLTIGLYGTQGIGKSTLARAVYHSIAHLFEASCFLDDIRQNSITRGLDGLQETLVSQIYGYTGTQKLIGGVKILKDGLYQKDVLLILDDVDSRRQLEALGRGPGWYFSPGSRVIITTRNKDLLICHGNDILCYDVRELNDECARKLLSHRAFEHGVVDLSYSEVLNRAIRYASGSPFVLARIGSYMRGKSVDECRKGLFWLERIPPNDIQNIQRALTTTRVAGVMSQAVMWRLVGLASSGVGLLCNALSPPFKRLIGGWNLLKLLLYVMFSVGLWATILYSNRSWIFYRLKCYICYVIFLGISVYSYLYERAVDGKPEILCLVSNAAFALTSLSLSKLFEAGFETGMFSYFLGCFTVQLITINWWLIFIAIISGGPLFDWHFSAEPLLITLITRWFGTIPLQNQND